MFLFVILHVHTSNFKQQKLIIMATQWTLDAAHSELTFKIKHMMISNVSGSFSKFDGTVSTEGDDLTTAKVNFTIQVDSISTNNEQRDGHLKSPDFFDTASYPTIDFVSTAFNKIDSENYKLEGNLTMHGVTNAVSLNVEYGGTGKDPWGNTRAGFTVEGKINRKDFGLGWNAALETGGVLVGEDVKLTAHVQFIKP